MSDQIAVQLVNNDFDQVLAEHFSDKEQFLLFARDQDFDLDTCLELCDHVAYLNEDVSNNALEDRPEIVGANKDFELQIKEYSILEKYEPVTTDDLPPTEADSVSWSWW